MRDEMAGGGRDFLYNTQYPALATSVMIIQALCLRQTGCFAFWHVIVL